MSQLTQQEVHLRESDEEDLLDLLIEFPNSKIYFGCDSIRIKKNGILQAKFATIVAVHKNGHQGCKIFYHLSYEPDYDKKANKPKMRMMNEVYKVIQMYKSVFDLINGFDVEIHLDISKDPKNGSSVAASEAAGYVLGMTGIEPKLKPDSWAASFGADGIGRGFHQRSVTK